MRIIHPDDKVELSNKFIFIEALLHQAIPSSFFQTTIMSKNDKYDAFKESIGVIFEVDKLQRPAEEFDAWIKSSLLGDLMLVEVQTVGQRFQRTSQMIAKDSLDHFLIQIFYSGFTSHRKNQDVRVCESGKILILDASKPWEAINSDFRNLTLVIPRRLLTPELINEDIHHGRMIDTKHNPFADILFKFMLSIDESIESINVEHAHSLTRPSIDLVAAALNFQTDMKAENFLDIKSSYQVALRFQIKNYLDRNLQNDCLGMGQIKYLYELSEEKINELFAQDGGLNSYLRKRRLERAFNRLFVPKESYETIAQIAFELGFQSEATFIQAFKDFYHIHPNEVKAQRGTSSIIKECFSNEGRQWERWFKNI